VNQIVGHDAQIEAILAAARSGRMHHGWLLTGPQGVGKASVALAVAKRLLAESSATPPQNSDLTVPEDHPTARLISAGSHPDLIILERLINEKTGERARSISVDQVRQLGGRFATTPSQSERRIVVIDAADDMERPAANALLKNLEEPPAHTVFLLLSHVAGWLLPTIRSRCTTLRFSQLADDGMVSVLRDQMPAAPFDEISALVAVGEGAPGRALSFVGLDIAEIDAALTGLAQDGDPSNATRTRLAQKLSLKSAQKRYEAFLVRAPAFIAQAARGRQSDALANALRQWEAARQLAQSAVPLSLDPQSTVFALSGHVAALAPSSGAAKA
jgi:DNA polymerase III subunit delta'